MSFHSYVSHYQRVRDTPNSIGSSLAETRQRPPWRLRRIAQSRRPRPTSGNHWTRGQEWRYNIDIMIMDRKGYNGVIMGIMGIHKWTYSMYIYMYVCIHYTLDISVIYIYMEMFHGEIMDI